MRTIRLLIEYDGTDYAGWQAQKNAPSIQAEIERAWRMVTGESLRVAGSGRTDAGVHARGQVASLVTSSAIPACRLAAAVNAHLPRDIAVLACEDAPEGFDARRHARRKTYLYRISNRPPRPVLSRNRVYHFAAPLDVPAMQQAAVHLLGEHDFRAFTLTRSSRHRSCVRCVFSLPVHRVDEEIRIRVTGNGFLHRMVRIMAGTLLSVGRGQMTAEQIPSVLLSCDPSRAGPTLPPCGLYLENVEY
jgi:tRNA pseudouridine38-40 synthase